MKSKTISLNSLLGKTIWKPYGEYSCKPPAADKNPMFCASTLFQATENKKSKKIIYTNGIKERKQKRRK
jgi:hypothetical protein